MILNNKSDKSILINYILNLQNVNTNDTMKIIILKYARNLIKT